MMRVMKKEEKKVKHLGEEVRNNEIIGMVIMIGNFKIGGIEKAKEIGGKILIMQQRRKQHGMNGMHWGNPIRNKKGNLCKTN